jgi:hypothetical protein
MIPGTTTWFENLKYQSPAFVVPGTTVAMTEYAVVTPDMIGAMMMKVIWVREGHLLKVVEQYKVNSEDGIREEVVMRKAPLFHCDVPIRCLTPTGVRLPPELHRRMEDNVREFYSVPEGKESILGSDAVSMDGHCLNSQKAAEARKKVLGEAVTVPVGTLYLEHEEIPPGPHVVKGQADASDGPPKLDTSGD